MKKILVECFSKISPSKAYRILIDREMIKIFILGRIVTSGVTNLEESELLDILKLWGTSGNVTVEYLEDSDACCRYAWVLEDGAEFLGFKNCDVMIVRQGWMMDGAKGEGWKEWVERHSLRSIESLVQVVLN